MKTIIRGVPMGAKKPVDLQIENGVVKSMGPPGKAKPDAGSAATIIGPTLFDIQVNGYKGTDLQGIATTPEDVLTVNDGLAATGVSRWIPTLITNAQDFMEHGCRVIAGALRDKTLARAVPGIHLEGPYISPEDGPRGAHARRHVRKPSIREFDRCMKAAEGKVVYTTIAPEVPGAIPFIKAVIKRGVAVSLGHHQATADDIKRAVDAGAVLSTHLGNGSASMMHRHVNPLWPQMAEDRLAASVIADLHHVPAPMLKTIARAKGPSRLVLTSDVVTAAGLKPGFYDLAGIPVELKPSGRICLTGTDLLAGSSLMLLQGVLNVALNTDLTLEEAFASANAIPAKLFGLPFQFALPVIGKKADFVAFRDLDGKAVIDAAFVNGNRTA
ncbi:MAG: hypothetical protein AMXMBFR84_00830 [Candidatus Hydrogenedentota bacterium]